MVTVTAPGADVLPWDVLYCTHPPGERCTGKKGCKVNGTEANEWNRTATARLRALHKAARSYAARRHPRADLPVTLGYVAQEQERGVWHFHVALGWTSRAALEAYVDGIQRNLTRHGFGTRLHRGARAQRPGALSTYMARYLSPGRYGSAFLRTLRGVESCDRQHRLAGHARTVQRPVYVSPTLSRRSGRTVAFEGFKRQYWCRHGNRPLDEVYAAYRGSLLVKQLEQELLDALRGPDPPEIAAAQSGEPDWKKRQAQIPVAHYQDCW